MPVRALIIDYKALNSGDKAATRAMLEWSISRGLRWCLFTTSPINPKQPSLDDGYPPPAAYVCLDDIPERKKRGSPAWVDVAAKRLGVKHNELAYVGTTNMDWRSAANAGVFYIHASWAGRLHEDYYAYRASTSKMVRLLVEQFLLEDPLWAFKGSGDNWELRCLLPASATLPCTSPGSTFKLQDVLTYQKTVKIGSTDARSILMLSVLANAYLEGLMTTGARMCIYPSSTPGQVSEQLSGYLQPASHLFRNYYRDDLLVRAKQAIDTSLERVAARRQGRNARVSIATQATTVHVGADYEHRKKLAGTTVIVADDFTTNGMSLDWARTLFTQAGAQRVILLAVGKYGGSRHTTYTPNSSITPHKVNGLNAGDFTEKTVPLQQDMEAEAQVRNRIVRIIGNTASG